MWEGSTNVDRLLLRLAYHNVNGQGYNYKLPWQHSRRDCSVKLQSLTSSELTKHVSLWVNGCSHLQGSANLPNNNGKAEATV